MKVFSPKHPIPYPEFSQDIAAAWHAARGNLDNPHWDDIWREACAFGGLYDSMDLNFGRVLTDEEYGSLSVDELDILSEREEAMFEEARNIATEIELELGVDYDSDVDKFVRAGFEAVYLLGKAHPEVEVVEL